MQAFTVNKFILYFCYTYRKIYFFFDEIHFTIAKILNKIKHLKNLILFYFGGLKTK